MSHRVNSLSSPGKVSPPEWVFASLSLAFAAVGLTVNSLSSLAPILYLTVLSSAALLICTLRQVLLWRLPGRLFLIGCTMGFFWIEALGHQLGPIPFEVKDLPALTRKDWDVELVRVAVFYVALLQMMTLVGYSLRPRLTRVLRVASARVDLVTPRASLLRYAFALSALVPLLVGAGFNLSEAIAEMTGGRGDDNVTLRDVGLLNVFNFVGLYGASLLLTDVLVGRSLTRLQKLALGAIASLPFVLGGARHLWLFVAIPVAVVGFRSVGRMTTIRFVKWVALTLLVLGIIQVQFLVRQEGWAQVGDLRLADLFEGQSTGQFSAVLFALRLVPDEQEYFREFAEPYFLIHWVPRRFWPDKPVMESWAYFNQSYTRGNPNYNVTPSIIGQFHINWGYAGVAYIGWFMGAITALADSVLRNLKLRRQVATGVAIGSFYAFIITSFRFYSPIYFTYFVFAWLGMLAITRSSKVLGKSERWTGRVVKRALDADHRLQAPGRPATSPLPR